MLNTQFQKYFITLTNPKSGVNTATCWWSQVFPRPNCRITIGFLPSLASEQSRWTCLNGFLGTSQILALGTWDYARTKFQTLINNGFCFSLCSSVSCWLTWLMWLASKTAKGPAGHDPVTRVVRKNIQHEPISSNQQRIHKVHFGGSGTTLQNYTFLPRTTPWIPEPWTRQEVIVASGWDGRRLVMVNKTYTFDFWSL